MAKVLLLRFIWGLRLFRMTFLLFDYFVRLMLLAIMLNFIVENNIDNPILWLILLLVWVFIPLINKIYFLVSARYGEKNNGDD